MTQELAKELISKGKNVFVTGPAGVGKSHIARETDNDYSITIAPTGIAALNAGGATCHKVFGLPLGVPTTKDYGMLPKKVKEIFGKDSKITTIRIDEIGMVRADMLDLIDLRLKKVKGNTLPFGGIQVVGFGDFYQIEPIVNKQDGPLYYQNYSTPFCFSSKSWDFQTIELSKVWRQENLQQVDYLNHIRKGTDKARDSLDAIVQLSKPYINSSETLHLCCYKDDAFQINDYWYSQEKGKAKKFKAKYSQKGVNWSEVPVDDVVEIKVGCKVLICANCPLGTYVNGDQGVVVGFSNESVSVEVKGNIVYVTEAKWEKCSYTNEDGIVGKQVDSTMIQMPLTLGHAITVHKSQGMTLDDVALDVGRGCFANGMFYMALSRIRDLTNHSFVRKPSYSDIRVSPHVQKFYANLGG